MINTYISYREYPFESVRGEGVLGPGAMQRAVEGGRGKSSIL